MARQRPLRAEIAERADDSLAVHDLPEAVDEDAGRQRVVARNDPMGQVEPRRPAALHVQRPQKGRHARRHDVAGVVLPVAAVQQTHRARGRRGRHQRHRERLRQLFFILFQLRQLVAGLLQLGRDLAEVGQDRLLLRRRALVRFDGEGRNHVGRRLRRCLVCAPSFPIPPGPHPVPASAARNPPSPPLCVRRVCAPRPPAPSTGKPSPLVGRPPPPERPRRTPRSCKNPCW